MENDKKARRSIHKWAFLGANTAALLPPPADAFALASEEALMTVKIAALFGHALTKKTAAQALATGAFGVVVGTSAAIAVFEGLDLAYPATIPAKVLVATGVMESLGWTVYEFYKNGQEILG